MYLKKNGGIGMIRGAEKIKNIQERFENMEIKKSGNHIVYIPTIGKAEKNKAFKLISNENDEFVFENNENDFPQRIYYRQAADSLYAWIEGDKNGKTLRMDFPYKRKKTADIP